MHSWSAADWTVVWTVMLACDKRRGCSCWRAVMYNADCHGTGLSCWLACDSATSAVVDLPAVSVSVNASPVCGTDSSRSLNELTGFVFVLPYC